MILFASVQVAAAGAAEPVIHRFLATAISPDGGLVASVEGDSPASGAPPALRDLVIRRTDGAGAVTVALPCAGEPQCWPASPTWSPGGERLAFTLRKPGTHSRSVYVVGPDGQDLRKQLDFDGTITALRYAPDGEIAMLATAGAVKEVGATEAGAPVTGDLAGPPPEQRIAIWNGETLAYASPPDLFIYEYDLVPGGGFVGTGATGDGDSHWWSAKLYAFSGGAARVLYAPTDSRQQIAAPQVAPDGRSVAFIGGLMSDFGSTGGDVFSVSLAGGPAANLTPNLRASATAIGWGCDGALLVRLLAQDATRIARLDGGGAPKILWSGQETLSGEKAGLSLACSKAMTATVHERFTAAQEIEVGAIGAWRDLTTANHGLSAPVRVKSISWAADGHEVQGWLLLPRDAPTARPDGQPGTYPLITEVHGGPAAAWTSAFVGEGLDRTLLDRGYALFRPNPRGSFGQGEAFTQGNVRDLGHGDLKDILAGVDAAERTAPIDEGRLGITGGSYGGFMTMWAVTQTGRFKAAVAAAGISDWLSYYGENGIDQWLIPYFGKSVYEDPAIYARSAPITFITKVKTPVFAYVGADDVECPAPQTQEFWHALRDLGVPTALAIYPGEGHGLRDAAHAADAERRTLEWFDRFLR
jgi:dipeptidyl aminopeptidase/acylaminoacyl peptidase